MAHKEVRDLIRKLERQGFTVKLAKSGHYKIYKGSQLLGTLPATPSDARSLKNAVAALKRAGFRP
ncbi:hypothetical protein [Streptomyces nanshensis]|uniref:Type II toxin-antitoxin system HicA family toxin n=1 Tax=Streptomyces nanshensis TaxID=518642 RepID=A0A1E7L6W5_9ACTN|nr:hypothetical protein [Streptomyces nanshensis]OEV11952.1 hypothetical protein AN218_10685 [Streptomyces nanshensis]